MKAFFGTKSIISHLFQPWGYEANFKVEVRAVMMSTGMLGDGKVKTKHLDYQSIELVKGTQILGKINNWFSNTNDL